MTAQTYRSALLDSLGWVDHAFQPAGQPAPDQSAYGHQRHTAHVVLDEQNIPAKSCESDGVISTGQRPVAVYTADCLPVLIADSRQQHVAAVHAGLKGALAGVLLNAVKKLTVMGATPDSLFAAIGPAISPCCYELGQDMLATIQQNPLLQNAPRWFTGQPENPAAVRPQARSHNAGIWFDLPALGRQMLLEAGIPQQQIDVLPVCTYCMAETGASYRRNTHTDQGYQLRFSRIRRLA